MARLPRLTVAGYPHHIIQRGNNGQPVFSTSGDRETFLSILAEQARQRQVALHAYVLMDNHFHLLASPASAEAIPRWMQAVGRQYVRYYNQRMGRTGTLWEGRYRSNLIQAERYLLACMVYLDLNPVRAGLVAQAADYPWSSHAHYVGLRHDSLVTPHPLYWALGNTPFARELAYAELVQTGIPHEQIKQLGESALQGWALGEPEYLGRLQQQTVRRVSKGSAGRPSKAKLPTH
ncbi:transposase [Ramlibacter tataouinensis]|uniref:Transposase IS200-like domain-containing protein n=1 Tax=Ramlibacter tataouinensis (strain ATCC BAA-407 / DSM 14655 / LMG 21543 / TTB310) TaxID=365046 RepID=F5XY97_RAMTT|nr:transposase [Ramlibacter tataouinensis]AEG91890.1 Conserved hypothetical protein [Ramlibacter tataouinensis TTB310]